MRLRRACGKGKARFAWCFTVTGAFQDWWNQNLECAKFCLLAGVCKPEASDKQQSRAYFKKRCRQAFPVVYAQVEWSIFIWSTQTSSSTKTRVADNDQLEDWTDQTRPTFAGPQLVFHGSDVSWMSWLTTLGALDSIRHRSQRLHEDTLKASIYAPNRLWSTVDVPVLQSDAGVFHVRTIRLKVEKSVRDVLWN